MSRGVIDVCTQHTDTDTDTDTDKCFCLCDNSKYICRLLCTTHW